DRRPNCRVHRTGRASFCVRSCPGSESARAGRRSMTQAIDTLVAEHADLERQLSDPELHNDAANARKVGRRFAQLAPIVSTHRKLTSARGDLETARELAVDDASFTDEVAELETRGAGWAPQL